MEDEEPAELDDVVVVGRRPDSGNYFISIPIGGVRQTYTIDQAVVDQHLASSGSTTAPDSQERFEEVGVFVLTELLKYLKTLPFVTPQELQKLDQVINQFTAASNAYALGQISRDDFRAAVQDGLEFLFEQIGDALGSAVTAAIIGAAASAGFAPTGPGGLAAGAIGIATGAAVAQLFPDEALAGALTDIIFGSAETINRLENQLQERLEDRLYNFYQEFLDYLFRNHPEDAPRPLTERGMIGASLEDDVSVYAGTIGRDNISFAATAAAVVVDMAIDDVQNSGGGGLIRMLTIDGVFGSQFNDTLLGNAMDNLFAGGGGDDYIDGRGGFDYADYRLAVAGVTVSLNLSTQSTGGAGTDTLINIEGLVGSQHNDALTGNAGANSLYGLGGDDTLLGEGGDDLLVGGAGHNTLDGGSGFDTVSYETETRGLRIWLGDGWQEFDGPNAPYSYEWGDTLISIEGVIGGLGSDLLVGSAGNNTIFGNAGHDTISGGDGDDVLEGGAGDDGLTGGAGFDTLSYATSASGVSVNLTAVQPDWWWMGSANVHTGGAGVDQLMDHFEGLLGSMHDDFLVGNFLDNDLRGSAGSDRLEGMGGNDRLIGGEGGDVLLGGLGADRFVYERNDDSLVASRDVILDFEVGTDLIDVSALGLTASNVSFAVSGSSTFVNVDLNLDGIIDLSVEVRGATGTVGLASMDFQ